MHNALCRIKNTLQKHLGSILSNSFIRHEIVIAWHTMWSKIHSQNQEHTSKTSWVNKVTVTSDTGHGVWDCNRMIWSKIPPQNQQRTPKLVTIASNMGLWQNDTVHHHPVESTTWLKNIVSQHSYIKQEMVVAWQRSKLLAMCEQFEININKTHTVKFIFKKFFTKVSEQRLDFFYFLLIEGIPHKFCSSKALYRDWGSLELPYRASKNTIFLRDSLDELKNQKVVKFL